MSTSLNFLATTYSPISRFRVDKHLDGYYTIQYMSEGAVELAYDGKSHVLTGEWFWPAYPGPHIMFQRAPGADSWFHRHVGFSGDLVFDWIKSGLWPTGAQKAPSGEDWPSYFDELISLAQRSDTWSRLKGVNRLEMLLITLAEARTAESASTGIKIAGSTDWVSQIVEKIGYGHHPDYEGIAYEEGMSVSTLRRHFRRAMGLSLHQYVIRRRIERSQSMLLETNQPLRIIAEALDYENEFFFARQFREVTGVTPGFFRRSRQI